MATIVSYAAIHSWVRGYKIVDTPDEWGDSSFAFRSFGDPCRSLPSEQITETHKNEWIDHFISMPPLTRIAPMT